MHSSPNRLAVSVTQFGSPKGRHAILDSRFWILDCGLKQHESHCRECQCGERGSSSIAFIRGKRNKGRPLSGPGNVDGPRCHANQVVPATGLVDDAITTARKKGIVDQAGKLDLLPCRGNGFPAIFGDCPPPGGDQKRRGPGHENEKARGRKSTLRGRLVGRDTQSARASGAGGKRGRTGGLPAGAAGNRRLAASPAGVARADPGADQEPAVGDAVALLHSYVEEVEAPSARVRLKLGQLLVQKQERPARALKVLGQIPEGSLPQPLEALRRQLIRQAEQLRADGVLELGDEV